jgi:tRNA threonylcarbamoyladenosine biosynthesis protein TsaE
MNSCSEPRYQLQTEADTEALARRVAPHLKGGELLILDGPLGSGKTFFTRALCRALGLPEDVRVPSPTFTLVHEHNTVPALTHADVYRLTGEQDVAGLGLDAQRDDGRVVIVEWGKPYIEVLGGDALLLELTIDPRTAQLSATGASASNLLQAVRNS